MIVLDTHVWVWWVSGDPSLREPERALIAGHQASGVMVSAISCLEVARLFASGRIISTMAALDWLEYALLYPGVRLTNLSARIAVESVNLPGEFHRDPADRLLVATARVLECPILTADGRILRYPHVERFGVEHSP